MAFTKRFIPDKVQPDVLTWPDHLVAQGNKFPAVQLATKLGNFAILGGRTDSSSSSVDAAEYYRNDGRIHRLSGHSWSTSVLISLNNFGNAGYTYATDLVLRQGRLDFPALGTVINRFTLEQLNGKVQITDLYFDNDLDLGEKDYLAANPDVLDPKLAIYPTGRETFAVTQLDPDFDLLVTTGRLVVGNIQSS